MTSNTVIRFVMALCMLAGLVIGHASFAAPTHAMAASTQRVTMPEDMDCCPKKQADPGYAKCPLKALCSSPFAEHLVDRRLR